MIATGSEDGAVRLWDAATGMLQPLPRGHQGAVHGVDFSPDGSQLASVGLDGKLRLWDARLTANRSTLPIQVGLYRQLVPKPDGSELAVASGPLPVRQLPGQIMFLQSGKPARVIAQREEVFIPSLSIRILAFWPRTMERVCGFGTRYRRTSTRSSIGCRDYVCRSYCGPDVIAGNKVGKILQWTRRLAKCRNRGYYIVRGHSSGNESKRHSFGCGRR